MKKRAKAKKQSPPKVPVSAIASVRGLSLDQRIGIMIVAWKSSADYRRSIGEISEAKLLKMCAETLESEYKASLNTK